MPFGSRCDVRDTRSQSRQALIQKGISERNGRFFEAEAEKLEGWADDLKLGLEREIKELDRLIKEARRAAPTALSREDKLAGQKQIKALESQHSQKRRMQFDAQDEVDRKRRQLIRLGSVNCRLLYFFHGRTVSVVAHGLTKEAAVPATDIKRAIARQTADTANPTAHTFTA